MFFKTFANYLPSKRGNFFSLHPLRSFFVLRHKKRIFIAFHLACSHTQTHINTAMYARCTVFVLMPLYNAAYAQYVYVTIFSMCVLVCAYACMHVCM